MEGICYVTWWHDDYLNTYSSYSLTNLSNVGANYIALLATWYMATGTSDSIASDGDKSPTDDAVRRAIRHAHERGMGVILKPHIDCNDSTWRGEINPSDKDAWFNSYNDFITHYAEIAEQEDVEIFCIGTELKSMSVSTYSSSWDTVISSVTNAYSGSITYAANASSEGDEYSTVCFWDQMDYAGIDNYFSLTDHNDPTVSELVAAWSNNHEGKNWVQILTDWQSSIGKNVIFTEIGYQSKPGTNQTPWATSGETVDLIEQRDCIEAMFQVWYDPAPSWLKGMFVWCWHANSSEGGSDDYEFYLCRKPAGDTISTWYGGSAYLYDFENGATMEWEIDSGTHLGAPYNSTLYSSSGTHSLAYPLTLGASLNDTAQVRSNKQDTGLPGKDLSNYGGIAMDVYIPSDANIEESGPVSAKLYIHTGYPADSNWDYKEGSGVNIWPLGTWKEITIDFASAGAENTNCVKDIGVNLGGASGSSGSTVIYFDSVRATGGDATAPSAITNLSALAGIGIDKIRLTWTAPGDNGQSGDNEAGSYYTVKYSMSSVDSDTTTWWNNADTYCQSWTVTTQGTDEDKTLQDFVSGTTYYFAIKTTDSSENQSEIDQNALNSNTQAWSVATDTAPPSAITRLSALTGNSAGEIDLTWTAPGDNDWTGNLVEGSKFKIQRSSYVVSWSASDAQITIDTTTVACSDQSYTVTGLTEGTTYYLRIWTCDETPNWSGLSNAATAWAQISIGDTTVPSTITNLSALTGSSPGQINLNWTAPGDDGYSGNNTEEAYYTLKYATYSVSGSTQTWWDNASTYSQDWTVSAQGTTENKIVYGLPEKTTIWFAIETTDESDNTSAIDKNTQDGASTQANAMAKEGTGNFFFFFE